MRGGVDARTPRLISPASGHARKSPAVTLLAVASLATALSLPAVSHGQVTADSLRTPHDSLAARDPSVDHDTILTGATRSLHVRPGVVAGSRQEETLRTLQLLGEVPLHQWSVRALGPRELERLVVVDGSRVPRSMHSGLCAQPCSEATIGTARFGLLPAEASARFNSAHPFGINDGPAWAGRGLSLAASAGFHGALGPVSAIIAPVLTWAQNVAFPLQPNGHAGTLRFADELYPTLIDHPQRFGDGAYVRVDPGESTVRIDLAGVAAGVSTAAQWWGPMSAYPFVLGNNAGGFAHLFAGTTQPANIGIGRLHLRAIYGELAQSAHANVPDSITRRFASGLSVVFTPRGLGGLEIGGARFFHSAWPSGGFTGKDFAKPFEGLLKVRNGIDENGGLIEDVHNQVASVFARLTLPSSGVELYGEYGREDHNADLRDFWMEPDHDATTGFGLRRAWQHGATRASVLTAEFVNFRVTHLARARPQVPPYIHTELRQGHTHRGQPLGIALGARSGDAAVVSLRSYLQGGEVAYTIARHAEAGGAEGAERLVRFIAGAERTVQRGSLEAAAGLSIVRRVGRPQASGATNVSLTLRSRWTPAAGR